MTGAEQAVLVPLVVVGVGVLGWAVVTRLMGAAAWIRDAYAPRPDHAAWLTDLEPIPDGWLQIVSMACDGDCARMRPHECDGVLAICIECGGVPHRPDGGGVMGLDTLAYVGLVFAVTGFLFRSGGDLVVGLALAVRDLLRRPSGRHRAAPPMPGVAPAAALTAARPSPVFDYAWVIGVLHPARNGRYDPANWYPSFKAAVDGIVRAGVLADDDADHLIGPDMRLGHPVSGGQIVLHIYAADPRADAWPTTEAAS